MRSILMFCALACMFSSLAAYADGSNAVTASEATTADPVVGVDLHSIIATVSRRTGKRFIIDPRVRANVDLVGLEAHDVTYPLLLTILAVHGYAASEQDGVIVVIPDANERQLPSLPMPPDNIRASDSEVVTTIVPLKNVKAAQLVPVLRPMMSLMAQLSATIEHNARRAQWVDATPSEVTWT